MKNLLLTAGKVMVVVVTILGTLIAMVFTPSTKISRLGLGFLPRTISRRPSMGHRRITDKTKVVGLRHRADMDSGMNHEVETAIC